jgi:hypothetical protein
MAVGADDCVGKLHLIGIRRRLGKQQSRQSESCGHAGYAGNESQHGAVGPRRLGPDR